MASIDRAKKSLKESKKRSLAQNRYRFGVLTKTVMQYINEHLEREGSEYRISLEDADFYIKRKALGIAHIIPTSLGDITIQGKLKTRDTREFEEAMEQIRAYFAKEWGLQLPLPNEPDWDNDYKDNLDREYD